MQGETNRFARPVRDAKRKAIVGAHVRSEFDPNKGAELLDLRDDIERL